MKVAVAENGRVGSTGFKELQAFNEICKLVSAGRNPAACQLAGFSE